MKLRSLMLDSGAFAVWTRGTKIDLDDYIAFCEKYPTVSYYVNLDVIPGRPNDPRSLTPKAVEAACEEGWANYQRMLTRLPKEKVIPVFHQGDRVEWLKRMLDFGAPYIGISPANDRTTDQRIRWMTSEVKPLVIGNDGEPVVEMHGFAVTSFRLMKFWRWKSVDSASWVKMGGLGTILIPNMRGGVFDYSNTPMMVSVTERPPQSAESNGFFTVDEFAPRDGKCGVVNADSSHPHLLSLTPAVRCCVDQYLEENRVGLGRWELVDVPAGYKPQKDERWTGKDKRRVIRVLEKGVITCNMRRKWLNMRFYQQANRVLPVESLYLAGLGVCKKIEREMENRLVSFHDVQHSNEARATFEFHAAQLR